MLLAANRTVMLLQMGAIIEQPEEWLSIDIHQFSELISVLFLRIFMC
jgi:hypothetical protein